MSTLYIRFAVRGPGALQRVPLLERLIARAAESVHVADWRAEAFRVIAAAGTPMPPIAAAALQAVGAAAGAWVCVATPVHLVAGMRSVTMPENGVLDLDPAEAAALATDFNRVFGDAGVRLAVGRSAVLLCVLDQPLEVATQDPEDALGGDVFGFQAVGADAPRLRQLSSEMEMWLFDHDVNRARSARSLLTITGLWLWGGGAKLSAMPIVHGWTVGRDALFGALRVESGFPSAGDGVVVCTASAGAEWLDIEKRWLAPAMAGLRSGRIERLELSAGDRRFIVKSGSGWRFWRRPRPWWESFDMEDRVE